MPTTQTIDFRGSKRQGATFSGATPTAAPQPSVKPMNGYEKSHAAPEKSIWGLRGVIEEATTKRKIKSVQAKSYVAGLSDGTFTEDDVRLLLHKHRVRGVVAVNLRAKPTEE